MKSRLLRSAGLALLVAMVLLAFLVPLPGKTLLAGAIQNALHTFAFAVFGFALNRYFGRPRQSSHNRVSATPQLSTVLLCTTLILFALAIVSEVIQPSTGRSFSTDDILRDFLGIAIGHIAYLLLCKDTFSANLPQPGLAIIMALLILLGLSQPIWYWYLSTTKPSWPMLADFEHPQSIAYISTFGGDGIERVSAPASWQNNRSMVIKIAKSSTRYSGFSLVEFTPGWHSLSHFQFDVFNPEDHPVNLNLRINDTHHNNQYHDRFNQLFNVAPGATLIRVAIQDILTLGTAVNDGRTMDISSISGLVFFMTQENAGDTLYLDNIQVR